MADVQSSREKRLPATVKFGYMLGQYTVSLPYNLFYFFFLIFLTDIAQIPATSAGILILIAIFGDALTDPIVGSFSDNLTLKIGRRRPLMILATFILPITLFLLFANFEGWNSTYKLYYFGVATILFWACFKIFAIPYYALGAEMTDNFNERTELRIWASFGIYGSILIATAAPPAIVGFATQILAMNASGGWMIVGSFFAFLVLITGLISWRTTRGRELANILPLNSDSTKSNFFYDLYTTLHSLLQFSGIRYLALSAFFWSGASAMLSGALIYLMDKNLGFSAGQISLSFLTLGCIAFGWLSILTLLSRRFDKRPTYYIGLGISAIALISFFFIGFTSLTLFVIFLILCELGNTFFWTISFSMMYDMSELDELVSGKRREGVIAAIINFMQKLGAAIFLGLSGIILGMSGYDGALDVQSDSAQTAIYALTTWIPGVLGLCAAIAGFAYPLTRNRFNRLMIVLEAKRAGDSYVIDEDLQKLL